LQQNAGYNFKERVRMEQKKEDFLISTDRSRLDRNLIHRFLADSYWAKNIPFEIMEKSIENSLCFGAYHTSQQVGFARVISDYATFAYIGDVFVLEEYRGRGLSKWLMECILQHPDLQNLRRWTLVTRDAHELYRKFGFTSLQKPERYMEILSPSPYGTLGGLP
jgi:GNAT superfamily N-acetyltransferase